MKYLYIFALLIHAAYSNICEDGVQILSRETSNPEDILGKWTYVYHWDNNSKYPEEFDVIDHSNPAECPEMQVTEIRPEYVISKSLECADYKIPFNWNDARLRVDAPAMSLNGSIIAIGEKDNWLWVDCQRFVRLVLKVVSDEYVVMTNPDVPYVSEMIARNVPSMEDLKCLVHNMDAVRDLKGVGLCYKK